MIDTVNKQKSSRSDIYFTSALLSHTKTSGMAHGYLPTLTKLECYLGTKCSRFVSDAQRGP